MRQYLEACQKIWEAYQLYAYHSFVLRSGHWLIGADCATDCWAAHMVACIKNFPAEILGPVMTLLDVAAKDVRGEEFPWLMKVFAEDEFSF